MGNSINHSLALNLKNKGNTNVARGDVVIIDKANADAFMVTGSQGLATSTIGVVLDQVGITTGSSGMVTIEGYCPQINLVTGANIGDTIFLSSISQKAQSHPTFFPGDFGQVLSAGTTPDAILWGSSQKYISDSLENEGLTANINLGTVTGSAWSDVVSGTIVFNPLAPGKYMVTWEFDTYVDITGVKAVEVLFRTTDGTINSLSADMYVSASATIVIGRRIVFSHIFNWTDTTPKTIKLQYWNNQIIGAGTLNNNLILGSVPPITNSTRPIRTLIYRLG
jgi:hypothetical protein